MLTRFALSAILLAWGGIVFAGDPVPPADPIQFPPAPVAPTPPTPAPGSAAKLTGKQVYPVTRVAPFALRAYPAGTVAIRKLEIPAGETHHFEKEFSDGTTEKSFKGPLTVYFVSPVGKGNIDLVATPIGLKSEAEIVTKTLDVDAGQGPQPPPVDPITDPFTLAIVAAFKADAGADKVATISKIASLYRMAAKTTAQDKTILTYGDLFKDMLAAGKVLIPVPGQLPGVRKVIDDRIRKAMNPDTAPIDRTLAAKELQAVADALSAAK